MKNIIHISIATMVVFFLSYQSGKSQNSQQIREGNYYKTWVLPIDKSSEIEGCLSEVGDSIIIITNLSNYTNQSINLKNVKEINFRKNGNIGKGVVFGALIGFSAGGILGIASGSDKNCSILCQSASQKVVIYGFLLSIPTALIGGIMGSAKITIPINGNSKNENEKLMKYKLSY